jgi:AraC-like DNA-binding protein
MDSKKLTLSLTKLQNSLLSPILINDALIDIIEVNVTDTGKATICAPHTHTWFEMNYTTKNPMWTTIDNETFEINEGEFFLIPPGIEHSHTYDPNTPNTCIVLRWMIRKNPQVNENKLESLYINLNRLNTLKPQAIKDNYKLLQLFEQIFEEAVNSHSSVSLQLLLVKIMTTLAELTTDKTITIYDKDKSKTSLIRKVEVILNDNTVKELTVDSIARSLHMSYGHLSRIYKKEAGITILERFNKIRLEKATELLLNTNYSIKEIAFKVGFSSQFYFSRLFHEKMGITPSDFRVKGWDKTNDNVYYP